MGCSRIRTLKGGSVDRHELEDLLAEVVGRHSGVLIGPEIGEIDTGRGTCPACGSDEIRFAYGSELCHCAACDRDWYVDEVGPPKHTAATESSR